MLLGDVPVDEAWLPVLLDQADWMLAMLAGAPALTRFAETLRAVMQWWDGTGPEGLEGSRIPLGARIVAVADAYDVIGERRR
ncbi:MAG: HD domain-containing phosphohydrolase, partial [Acidobacteriota bacterium]